MSKTRITIMFEGEVLELRSGFVGGFLSDISECPMGMYAGDLNIEETIVSLTHFLRSVIKMSVEEHGLNLEQTKKFIEISLNEALKIEMENNDDENVTLNEHKEMLIKIKKDSKNFH